MVVVMKIIGARFVIVSHNEKKITWIGDGAAHAAPLVAPAGADRQLPFDALVSKIP